LEVFVAAYRLALALLALFLASSFYFSFSVTSLSKPTFFPFLLGFLDELITS
jgi:hypothetical protein